MGSLKFMNQDGEWEKFPDDEDMQALGELMALPVVEPIYPDITTVCYLCNEPFPVEHIRITGGDMLKGYTWSCPKCHAVTSLGKA